MLFPVLIDENTKGFIGSPKSRGIEGFHEKDDISVGVILARRKVKLHSRWLAL
jgi:hypothetical protein